MNCKGILTFNLLLKVLGARAPNIPWQTEETADITSMGGSPGDISEEPVT